MEGEGWEKRRVPFVEMGYGSGESDPGKPVILPNRLAETLDNRSPIQLFPNGTTPLRR